jgi:HAD superfamily hydrolase (TIGR01509 family)
MPQTEIDHVIFDIGNVLVDWNPRHLYRKLLGDEEQVEAFLQHYVPMSWHSEFDAGKPFAKGVEERIALFPDQAELIRAWDERWSETISGPIEGTVTILAGLKASGIPVFAITNYSREKFDKDRLRFPFYDWFEDIVVSGDVGLLKPAAAIYELLLERNGLDPGRSIFIDDRLENVRGAEKLGLHIHHFSGPERLAEDLRRCRLPV